MEPIEMTSSNSDAKTDMSPHAVTTRLKRVAQLRALCLALAKAKPVPPKLQTK